MLSRLPLHLHPVDEVLVLMAGGQMVSVKVQNLGCRDLRTGRC
jgi:hypothetical protein